MGQILIDMVFKDYLKLNAENTRTLYDWLMTTADVDTTLFPPIQQINIKTSANGTGLFNTLKATSSKKRSTSPLTPKTPPKKARPGHRTIPTDDAVIELFDPHRIPNSQRMQLIIKAIFADSLGLRVLPPEHLVRRVRQTGLMHGEDWGDAFRSSLPFQKWLLETNQHLSQQDDAGFEEHWFYKMMLKMIPEMRHKASIPKRRKAKSPTDPPRSGGAQSIGMQWVAYSNSLKQSIMNEENDDLG